MRFVCSPRLVLTALPALILTGAASSQSVIFEDDFNFAVDGSGWATNFFHGSGVFPNSSVVFDPSFDDLGPTGGTGTAKLRAATNPVGGAFGLAAMAGGGALEVQAGGTNQAATGATFDFQADVVFSRTAFESGAFGATSTPSQPGRPSGMFSIAFFGADDTLRLWGGNTPGENPGEVDLMVAMGTGNLAFDNPGATFFEIDGDDDDADGTVGLTLRNFGSLVNREISYRITESVADLLVDGVSIIGGPVAHGLSASFFQDNLTNEFRPLNVGVESWHDTGSPAASEHWVDLVRLVDNAVTIGLAGDYNNNGSVEQGDLDLVLNNWGGPRTAGFIANADGFASTNVDQEELDRVLNNWGSSNAPAFNSVSVPEPALTTLLLGGVLAGSRRRTRA